MWMENPRFTDPTKERNTKSGTTPLSLPPPNIDPSPQNGTPFHHHHHHHPGILPGHRRRETPRPTRSRRFPFSHQAPVVSPSIASSSYTRAREQQCCIHVIGRKERIALEKPWNEEMKNTEDRSKRTRYTLHKPYAGDLAKESLRHIVN